MLPCLEAVTPFGGSDHPRHRGACPHREKYRRHYLIRVARAGRCAEADGRAVPTGPWSCDPEAVTRRGRLRGPFNAMLLSPPLGGALQALGTAVRYGSTLTDRERELAILVVTARWDSAFGWESHEAIGRAAGVTQELLAALRAGAPLSAGVAREHAVVGWARALAEHWDADDDSYADALAALDPRTASAVRRHRSCRTTRARRSTGPPPS